MGRVRGEGRLLRRILLPLVLAGLEVPPADGRALHAQHPDRSRRDRSCDEVASPRPGASRQRCCDTTASRTLAASAASTIRRALGDRDRHRLLDEHVLAGARRPRRPGRRGRRAASSRRRHRRPARASSASSVGSSGDAVVRRQRRRPAAAGDRDERACPSAWFAATSAHVRPMKPEPRTPIPIVIALSPLQAGVAISSVTISARRPGRPPQSPAGRTRQAASSTNSSSVSNVLARPGTPAMNRSKPSSRERGHGLDPRLERILARRRHDVGREVARAHHPLPAELAQARIEHARVDARLEAAASPDPARSPRTARRPRRGRAASRPASRLMLSSSQYRAAMRNVTLLAVAADEQRDVVAAAGRRRVDAVLDPGVACPGT